MSYATSPTRWSSAATSIRTPPTTSFLDDTPTADLIQGAGYAEVWPLMHPASDPGLTWPLYLEDQVPPPSYFAPFQTQRADRPVLRARHAANQHRPGGHRDAVACHTAVRV